MSKLSEVMNQFPLGTGVRFAMETFVDYSHSDKENGKSAWQYDHLKGVFKEILYGQVVGATYLQEGLYHPAYSSPRYADDESYEPAYLSPTKQILVLLVKTQYRGMKLHYVRPEDVIVAHPASVADPIPLQKGLSEDMRRKLSRDMGEDYKKYPQCRPLRDSKGRFTK